VQVGKLSIFGALQRSLFWVWALIALGATASFSVILSARGLWNTQWRQSR
jgi:hypothetical protein